MDFQTARELGYYFDRCIDLTFYDTEMNFIAILNTPKRGLKPTITIKGTFIEGGYAIDSYISIQNMAFDVDVAYVGYIKAHMYYSGLSELIATNPTAAKVKRGHTILYKVLYADQEKEPPNRCVRFQCVVASKDITVLNTELIVNGGTVLVKKSGEDENSKVQITSKSESKVALKKLCEEIISAYNSSVDTVSQKDKTVTDEMKIKLLEIDEPLEKLEVEVPPGSETICEFIRTLNNSVEGTDKNGFPYAKFKMVIDRGSMRVTTPLPNNWKSIGKAEGYSDLEKYYNDTYASVNTNTYSIIDNNLKKEKASDIVPLKYVKSATRSECVVYIETLFDDRITPGCKVAIKSNAIMGKRFGSKNNATKGSRILHYFSTEQKDGEYSSDTIIIRNTGKIEYLFSTTEDSYMKMQGPVDESDSGFDWREKAKEL